MSRRDEFKFCCGVNPRRRCFREPLIDRHARAGGHPDAFEFPGFPPSRERRKWDFSDLTLGSRAMTTDLFSAETYVASRRPLAQASPLPGWCYVSPEWHAREIETIF